MLVSFNFLWPFLSRNIKSFKMYARNFTRNRKKITQSGEKTKTFRWCLDMHWISRWVGMDRKVGDKFWGGPEKAASVQNWLAKKHKMKWYKKQMSFGWICYASTLKIQLFKFCQRGEGSICPPLSGPLLLIC
jgi:hypothetical protein